MAHALKASSFFINNGSEDGGTRYSAYSIDYFSYKNVIFEKNIDMKL